MTAIQSDLAGIRRIMTPSTMLMGRTAEDYGYRPKRLFFSYGEQGCGKTTFDLGEAATIAKATKKNILYLRAEKTDFEFEAEDYALRLGLGFSSTSFTEQHTEEMSKSMPSIIYQLVPSWSLKHLDSMMDALLYNLIGYFGCEALIEHSEKGNVKFHIRESKGKVNPFEEAVKKYNIGVLVLDSISDSLKNLFLGIDNAANRSNALNALLFLLTYETQRQQVYSFVIHHARGVDPNNPHGQTKMYAQDQMGYKADYQFLLTKYVGKKTRGFAKVTGTRIPGLGGGTEGAPYCFLKLVEGKGFVDATDDEVKELDRQPTKEPDETPIGESKQ